jgi:hypothetical protein
MDDDIEEAADHQAEQAGGEGKHRRIGELRDHSGMRISRQPNRA